MVAPGIRIDTTGQSGQKKQNMAWGLASRPGIRLLNTAAGPIRLLDTGGRGTTLVLAADGPNMIEHYDRTLAARPDGLRVVCIDPPGNGFSAPSEEFAFTIDAFADVMIEILDALDIRDAVLGFGCVQAFMALKMAVRRPDQVAKLVLLQVPAWDEAMTWLDRVIDPKRALRVPGDGQMIYAKSKYAASEWWYDACLGVADDRPYFVERAHEAFDHGACHCLASLVQAMFAEPAPAFEKPSQDCVVIWGLRDGSHAETKRRSILDHVPHARFIEWTDAGHAPEIQQSERFMAVIRELAPDL